MTVADRWFYLPMIGLIGAVGSGLALLPLKAQTIKLVMLLGLAWATMLGLRSAVRIQNWHDGLTLYRHDSQIMQQSFDLENNLGVELYRAGETAAAAQHFQHSTELAPAWWTNWNNLGVTAEAAGQLDQAAADYQKAIQNGSYYLAYGNYAQVLLKQGRYEAAAEFLHKSLELYPHNQALLNLSSAVDAYLADPFRASRAHTPLKTQN
jgi:tetratricopeptide (TPR) repeat protein